jgi:putative redox protein
MKSVTTWIKSHQMVVNNGRNHGIVIDLPDKKGGNNDGATALELIMMALSGCIGTIYTTIAKKMRIELKSLIVDLVAEKSEEAPTVTKVKADVTVGSDVPEEKLKKCLDQTMEYCPVGKLYEQACVPLEVNLIKK